jgi:hypothetical protein
MQEGLLDGNSSNNNSNFSYSILSTDFYNYLNLKPILPQDAGAERNQGSPDQ